MSSGINVLLPCIPAETNVCVFLFRECYWVGSWRENWFSHEIMRTQWAVHAALPIKMFHPKLAKSEMWHCVFYGKLFQSRERGPWEGSPRKDIGVSVGWAVWSWLPVWCHWPDTARHMQEAVAAGMTSLTEVAFRLFTVELPLDPWWNCLAGLWALYFENKSPFSPRYKWQVGIEAEPSKLCFIHQLSECVRLLPLANGNKTDESPYMVFDNIFESLMEPC